MKYIITLFFIIFPFSLFSYFNYDNCENETIFYVQDVTLKQATLGSLYCSFWRLQTYELVGNKSLKKNIFVKYDQKTKTLSSLSSNELGTYFKRLKQNLKIVKNDTELKNVMRQDFIDFYRDHEDALSVAYKKMVFSSKEMVDIFKEVQKTPYRFFQKTLWERLLMNGEIISREEWGADENYSKREVYMKGCEDGSCLAWWPVAPDQLKQNYIENFLSQDQKDKVVKTFDDGRDPIQYYPVDRIIIHHTAGKYIATKDEGLNYMRSLQRYHALTLRWWDIGYHYLIDGEGNIYEGRAWGKYVLGAHVATHNYGSIGISLMSDGDYSDAMLASLKKLVVYLWEEYHLDITNSTRVRSDDLSEWTQWPAVIAHKELDKRKPLDPEVDMEAFRAELARMVK